MPSVPWKHAHSEGTTVIADENIPNTPAPAKKAQPRVAVWFFVAATFAFVSPSIWFRDAEGPLVTIVSMTLGAILFAAGIVVLAREPTLQKHARVDETPPPRR